MAARHDELSKGLNSWIFLRSCVGYLAGSRRDGEVSRAALKVESWEGLKHWIEEHRLSPLVLRALESVPCDGVPPRFLDFLRDTHRNHVTAALFLTGELRALLRLLQEHGCSPIAFKGPLLAQLAYCDLALRDFRDLDILVPERDVAEACQTLRGRGYRQEEVWQGYNATFSHPVSRIVVELHWGLTPRNQSLSYPLLESSLWRRIETVELGGEAFSSFAREELILLLCLHGAKHRWERMIWLADLAMLLGKGGFCWDRLLVRARELRYERMLRLGLILVKRLFGLRLPSALEKPLREDRALGGLLRQVVRRQLEPGREPFRAFGRSLFHCRVRESLRDRIHYCLRLLSAVDEDRLAWQAPGRLSFLHYLVRPWRLLIKYGRMALAPKP